MMKKRFLKWLPMSHKVADHKSLHFLAMWLKNPNLWHINRYSISTAVSIGLFCAFIPLPMQMLMATSLSILCRGNVFIAIALTWITNPFTAIPAILFSYKVGALILNTPIIPLNLDKHFNLLHSWHAIQSILTPFLFGCLFTAVTAALLGNLLVRGLWRAYIIFHWRKRKQHR